MKLIDQVRKWGLSYNGMAEPLVFIERLEELADIYDVILDQLPKVMPEFLCERALVWYRNNNAHWQVWCTFKTDFLAFFLPSRYFEKLEDDIRSRLQLPGECFKDYILALQNLMRHSSLTKEQQLQRIFRNARAEYQWYVKQKDFSSLNELIKLAEDLEGIPGRTLPTRTEVVNSPAFSSTSQQRQCHLFSSQGHYESRCPEKKNQRSEKCLRGPTKLNFVGPPYKKRRSYHTTNQLRNEETRLTASLRIANITAKAIIDTGASQNFIHNRCIQRLNPKPRLIDDKRYVILADGSTCKVSQAVELQTKLGNLSRKCRFLVMSKSCEDLIVGLEFLRQFNTNIQIAGITLDCSKVEARKMAVDEPSYKDSTPPINDASTPRRQADKLSSSVTKLAGYRNRRNKLVTDTSGRKFKVSPTPSRFIRVPGACTDPYPGGRLLHSTTSKSTTAAPYLSLYTSKAILSPTKVKIHSPSPNSRSPSSTSTKRSSRWSSMQLSLPKLKPTTLTGSPGNHSPAANESPWPVELLDAIEAARRNRKKGQRLKFLHHSGEAAYRIIIAKSGSVNIQRI